MSMRKRALPAAGLSLVLAVGSVACGEEDRDRDAAGASGGADTPEPADPSSEGTAADTASGSTSGQDGYEKLTDQTLAESMTSAMYAQETVHIEMRSGLAEILDADYRFAASGDVAMAGTVRSGEAPLAVVVVDGTVFVKEDSAPKWTRLPADIAASMLEEFENTDPTKIAETFESGLDRVTYGGVDEVDGLKVHGYDVTLRDDFLSSEMGVPPGEVPDVEYTLWLDEDHLLRRMDVSVDGLELQALLSRWGTPVSIEAPPADEVDRGPGG